MATASRAAAKRLAAQARASANEPRQNKPENVDYLQGYTPDKVDTDTWAAIRPAHSEIMLAAGIQGQESFKKRSRELAHYLARRHEDGRSIAIGDALTYEAIDQDYARPVPGLNERSRNDRRSRLRKIAEAVNPTLAALPRAAPLGHQAIKPPYTRTEELTIKRIAHNQRHPGARCNLSAAVGLCAGAGLDSPDLRALRTRHIEDRLDDGIFVNVPGNRPRTVVVRREYEEHVRIGLAGLRPNDLLIGKVHSRRNIVGGVVQNAEIYGDVPHIEASRLRATWLAWLMCRPVPLDVILAAAGLKSSRTLIDLLTHLPARPIEPGLLRGEELAR